MRGYFEALWWGAVWRIATKTNNFIGIEIVGQSKRPFTAHGQLAYVSHHSKQINFDESVFTASFELIFQDESV